MADQPDKGGNAAARYMAAQSGGRRADLPKRDRLNAHERRALATIRREARTGHSFLSSGGKGGLPPSLVLHVMRRDAYTCKTCGEKGDQQKNQGIGVHHKGGIVASKWLSRQGHHNTPANLVTICGNCHDREHEAARAAGEDATQVTPEGDKGTKRDHGKPDADPPT